MPQRPLDTHSSHMSLCCRICYPRCPGGRSFEGLRPWGTGAAGTRAPELIGDPRDNEGWKAGKAGGLIGPGSGQTFVWDKAQPIGRRISPPICTWPCSWGPAEHWGGNPGRGVCKAESKRLGGFSKLRCRSAIAPRRSCCGFAHHRMCCPLVSACRGGSHSQTASILSR